MTTPNEIEGRFWKELHANPVIMIAREHAEVEHSQPMTVHFEGNGPLWMYTHSDNRLIAGLGEGAHAMAQYVAKGHDLFACLHGRLSIDNNAVAIDRFWSKHVASWFEGGRDDPSLTMLRFNPESAEVWLADMSVAGKFKMLFGGDLRDVAVEQNARIGF